jgi:hypothetical protein
MQCDNITGNEWLVSMIFCISPSPVFPFTSILDISVIFGKLSHTIQIYAFSVSSLYRVSNVSCLQQVLGQERDRESIVRSSYPSVDKNEGINIEQTSCFCQLNHPTTHPTTETTTTTTFPII